MNRLRMFCIPLIGKQGAEPMLASWADYISIGSLQTFSPQPWRPGVIEPCPLWAQASSRCSLGAGLRGVGIII